MNETATAPAPDRVASSAPTADSAPVAPPARKRRGPVFWLVVLVVTAGALLWIAKFAVHAYRYVETDDAYVNGHVHQISSRVAGSVTDVLVNENQQVKAGQVLAKIDPLEFEIALHRAQANLAQSKAEEAKARAAISAADAQVSQLEAQVGQTDAEVARAQAQLAMANDNLERNTKLYSADSRAVAKADLDETKRAYETNTAMLAAAKANAVGARSNVAAAKAQSESAAAQLGAAQATVAANEAAVKDAERQLSYASITAPVDGRTGNKNIEVGNRVQVGQALFALVQPDLWIIANFKETQLAHVHRGQEVEFTVDAVPGHEFRGHIESISPATGAQFALLPPDNATGNFTKVVQRVPLKIVFDRDSVRGFEDRLRSGLSAVVNVRIR